MFRKVIIYNLLYLTNFENVATTCLTQDG